MGCRRIFGRIPFDFKTPLHLSHTTNLHHDFYQLYPPLDRNHLNNDTQFYYDEYNNAGFWMQCSFSVAPNNNNNNTSDEHASQQQPQRQQLLLLTKVYQTREITISILEQKVYFNAFRNGVEPLFGSKFYFIRSKIVITTISHIQGGKIQPCH